MELIPIIVSIVRTHHTAIILYSSLGLLSFFFFVQFDETTLKKLFIILFCFKKTRRCNLHLFLYIYYNYNYNYNHKYDPLCY